MSGGDLTVCLVGCGKAKAARSCAARDLYTGSLFRAARRFAETCDAWLIISARFGLVDPAQVLAPYDQRIPRNGIEQRQFAIVNANRLADYFRGRAFRVTILAGADYADPLADVLRERGIDVTVPLAGLGIGHRLQWLARNTSATADARVAS